MTSEYLQKIQFFLGSLGYELETTHEGFRLTQVGYSNKSVDMTIQLVQLHDELLIEFESKISTATTFEKAALAVFEGNRMCRIVGFSAEEQAQKKSSVFQVVARAHLYANYFSKEELGSMIKLYLTELDAIDERIRMITE